MWTVWISSLKYRYPSCFPLFALWIIRCCCSSCSYIMSTSLVLCSRLRESPKAAKHWSLYYIVASRAPSRVEPVNSGHCSTVAAPVHIYRVNINAVYTYYICLLPSRQPHIIIFRGFFHKHTHTHTHARV